MKEVIAVEIFNEPELAGLLIYGAIFLVILTLQRILNGIFRAYKALKYFVISNECILRLGFIAALIFFYLLKIRTAPLVLSGLILSQVAAVVYLISRTDRLGLNLFKVISYRPAATDRPGEIKRELFSYSTTVIFISLMGVILRNIDKVMIGVFKSSEMVGTYNIAVRVSLFATFFLGSTNMIFSTIISELYSTHKMALLDKLYSTITRWVVIFTIPVVCSMVIFSGTIVRFFGAEYTAAAGPLIILALGDMINAFVGANGYILALSGNEKLLLLNNLSMAVINVILNILLIPRIGIVGAAIATGLSIATINIVKLVEVKVILDLFPYDKTYFHVALNILVIGGVSLGVKFLWNNIIAVLIVTFINFGLSVLIALAFKTELDDVVLERAKRRFLNFKS